MRIVHILNAHSEEGNGIVNVTIDTACLQAKLGHDVVIVSREGGFEDVLAAYGVRHVAIDQRRTPLRLVRALVALRAYVRVFKPDIVHAHVMTGLLLAIFVRGRRPYRIVATLHNEFQRSSWLMRFADRIIAVSDAVAASWRRRGIALAKVHVVLNGPLGSPRLGQRTSKPIALHHPAIVTVAGLFELKGIFDLIAAFDILAQAKPAAHLYIVGDGPDRKRFEHAADASPNRARIHFEGFQADSGAYMRASHVFVLASHRDSAPLAIPEAREAGCAIVATTVDGIPEMLEFGRCGVLVPTHDPSRLAEAITMLLEDETQRLMYRSAAATNLERFSAERVARETLAVYVA